MVKCHRCQKCARAVSRQPAGIARQQLFFRRLFEAQSVPILVVLTLEFKFLHLN
jgi:hypothetical protein